MILQNDLLRLKNNRLILGLVNQLFQAADWWSPHAGPLGSARKMVTSYLSGLRHGFQYDQRISKRVFFSLIEIQIRTLGFNMFRPSIPSPWEPSWALRFESSQPWWEGLCWMEKSVTSPKKMDFALKNLMRIQFCTPSLEVTPKETQKNLQLLPIL